MKCQDPYNYIRRGFSEKCARLSVVWAGDNWVGLAQDFDAKRTVMHPKRDIDWRIFSTRYFDV